MQQQKGYWKWCSLCGPCWGCRESWGDSEKREVGVRWPPAWESVSGVECVGWWVSEWENELEQRFSNYGPRTTSGPRGVSLWSFKKGRTKNEIQMNCVSHYSWKSQSLVITHGNRLSLFLPALILYEIYYPTRLLTYRNRLDVCDDLRLKLTSIHPNIEQLCRNRQAHPSH
jgi:hypothetical protein